MHSILMEPVPEFADITIYLRRLSNGDASAEEPLADAVYAQLQKMARGLMRGRQDDCLLQPTALVNEVLMGLVRLRSIEWQDRVHFFRVASRMLRRRFIDHIKSEKALKRPPAVRRVEVDDLLLPDASRFEEILFVHEGLDQLAEFDSDLAELVEMIYFGGVTIAAAAELRNVSEKTIDRHIELARRWLAKRFRRECPSFHPTAASAYKGR